MLVGAIAGIALAGCGDDGVPPPSLNVGIAADWNWSATSADQIGFVYTLVVYQKKNSAGTCDYLSPSLRVFAFGQSVPFVRDADNCLCARGAATPTMVSSSVTVTAEQDGQTIATGTFDDLIPGLGAVLVAPADGMVHAGDEVVMTATPGLPSSNPGPGWVFPLEGTPWPGSEHTADFPARFSDGIHVKMPVFSGRAAVVLKGTPYLPPATVNCEGFVACVGHATNALGPVFVTEAM
jgi:hypothetical protein